jgi:hypothetical protein
LRRCVPGALEGDLARPNNLLPYPFFLACTGDEQPFLRLPVILQYIA